MALHCLLCVLKNIFLVDLRESRPTEGSTELSPLVCGVETAPWSFAAEKARKCYRGVLEACERLMVRWHEDDAQLSRQRRTSARGVGRGSRGHKE